MAESDASWARRGGAADGRVKAEWEVEEAGEAMEAAADADIEGARRCQRRRQ